MDLYKQLFPRDKWDEIWAVLLTNGITQVMLPVWTSYSSVNGGGVSAFKGSLIRLNKILGSISFTSRQDGWTRFTHPPEKKKKQNWQTKRQNTRKNYFQGIIHQVTKESDAWEVGNRWSSCYYCPSLLLMRGNPGETFNSLVDHWAESPGRPRQLEHADHQD